MQIRRQHFFGWFLADAATCFATGLLVIFGSTDLGQFLEMSLEFLLCAGISLLPFTASVGYMATRQRVLRVAVRTVIALNALWMIDSFLITATGWVTQNQLGCGFIGAHALDVTFFAGLEYVGLTKSPAAVL